MSNSQNKKNEQQNNLCTTLTEQWKKGELELGECYFIRLKSGKIIPQMYSFVCIDGKHHCTDFGLSYVNVEEVLAPVPSYEEWQAKDSQIDYLQQKVSVLESKNQQLKELLCKCREELDELDYGREVWQGELTGFIEEIDEVLK